MNITWQDVTALLIVLAAAAYVVRLVGRRIFSKRSVDCTSCGCCSKAETRAELITIGPISSRTEGKTGP